jgi:hypothetical protein
VLTKNDAVLSARLNLDATAAFAGLVAAGKTRRLKAILADLNAE